MSELELEYSVDQSTADNLQVNHGHLSEPERTALCEEIRTEYSRLATGGEFRPRTPLRGVSDGAVFHCTPDRSGDPRLPTLKLSLVRGIASETVAPLSRRTIPRPQRWTEEFLQALDSGIGNLAATPQDGSEEIALRYAIAQLRKDLTDANVDSSLVLFLGYLHFIGLHLAELDEPKAALYTLAARAVERIGPDRSALSYAREPLSANPAKDISGKAGTVFRRIFRKWWRPSD